MERANPKGPGRRCAFCGEIGGTGFPEFLIARFGGTKGSTKHAHSGCFTKAKAAYNARPENLGADDRAPR